MKFSPTATTGVVIKPGKLVITSVPKRAWRISSATVCGVVPGIDWACESVELFRA